MSDEVEKLLSKYRAESVRWRNEASSHERLMRRAENEQSLVDAKIIGILETLEALKGVPIADADPPKLEHQAPPSSGSVVVNVRRRRRKLSPEWQQIMQYVDHPEGFGYEELAEAAAAVGHVVAKDNLRSQMSLYKSAGLVDAVGSGRFRLTDNGRNAAGIAIKVAEAPAFNENGGPEGPPDAGGAATPSSDSQDIKDLLG